MKCKKCGLDLSKKFIFGLRQIVTEKYPYNDLVITMDCPHCNWKQEITITEYLGMNI